MFNVKKNPYTLRNDLQFDLYKFKTKKYGYKSLLYAGYGTLYSTLYGPLYL